MDRNLEPKVIQGRWQRAMCAVARAQEKFSAVEYTVDPSDPVYRRAWMGLWRAEQYQLAVMRSDQAVG